MAHPIDPSQPAFPRPLTDVVGERKSIVRSAGARSSDSADTTASASVQVPMLIASVRSLTTNSGDAKSAIVGGGN